MKRPLLICLFTLTCAIAHADPALDNLSQEDLEEVSNEIAANFSHTAVAAPETNGLWGIEVGLVGGTTNSSKLKKLINEAGGNGKDYGRIPHAGLMARVHIPFDFFAELSFIPESEVEDMDIQNGTMAVGWNVGRFFDWPLDVALGVQGSASELSFKQTLNNASTGNTDVDADVSFKSKTSSAWIGVSKTFLFVTPYAKIGSFKSESDVEVDTASGNGDIFSFTNQQKEDSSATGTFTAVGVNVQLLLFRLGVELSRSADVGRASGKLALSF